jgi:hypothetical protein
VSGEAPLLWGLGLVIVLELLLFLAVVTGKLDRWL